VTIYMQSSGKQTTQLSDADGKQLPGISQDCNQSRLGPLSRPQAREISLGTMVPSYELVTCAQSRLETGSESFPTTNENRQL
jgi:hypothetical protein